MREAGRALLAVWLVLLLAACESAPRLAPLAADDTLLAFGDSLTYGTGATETTAYPAVLSALIGKPVVNAGIPGDTTASALQRLPSTLEAHHPRLVLLCLGGNDMLRKWPAAETERNLRQIVATIRASGAQVVLIGVPAPRLFGGPPEFYARIADDLNVPFEADAFNTVLKDNRLKSDPIHANAAGYHQVATALAAFLRQRGAL